MYKENAINKNYHMTRSDRDREKYYLDLDKTAADLKDNVCLHELLDAVAKRQPDAVAVVFEKKQLTYGELIKRANQLAHYLQKLGVVPDTLVGLCVERSLDMIIGVIAIQKAGGAYVPLDPAFPLNRIELVLEDSRAKILLTEEKQLKLLGKSPTRTVCIDTDWSKISEEKTIAPDSGAKPANLAYVMYTSGSTGKPKGVQIEHRSVVNFLNSMRKTPGFTSHDTLLAVTTLSFDISVLELFLPLTTGARIVLLPNEKTADGTELIKAVEENQITVMQATPASWRLMIESGWEGSHQLKALCGGEPMSADLARELIPRCSALWNMYGPTETTIWSTCAQITDPYSINIGRPIDNTDIHILDNNLTHQPIGIEGELMIGGAGLARGYINLPALTDEKFIPHPFIEGLRIYRTGDIARYLEDGSIKCLGRIDDQVKLHGFRIELGEIESHLSRIDGIMRSSVMLREDRPGHKRLVAYYLSKAEQAPDVIRQSLLSNLPEYMVPSVFMRVDKFPLTPNGKLDRKALPPPQQKRPLLSNSYIIPRSPIEKKMAECWNEVLDIEGIGINDNFFDLGGTSLLAARMVTLWQKKNELKIPLVKVFQYPTISLLANWLSEQNTHDDLIHISERRISRLRETSRTGTAQIPIAIVGMAGRFPGAENLDTLWNNLCNGIESISVFDREELGIGIDEAFRYDSDYIPARGIISGAEYFDAAFFGISPLEASVMDPQQRVFLELAYEAMENAGYDPDRCPGPVGVYAGVGDNHYYSINLLSNPDIIKQAGNLVVEYGNEKDYIALRVAYALGLTGPAISANTACSTSLVAVDNAVQGLSNFDCDLALAGGIDICIPQKSGFLYMDGGVFSKDGHCKPFDADATGTMFCDGAGLVVLKRLDDAINDNDTIYAVVCGSAKNSNGSRPASFLAPSVDGQAEVIALAQARAAIPVETIGYIEAHGTGTPIGDPIEIEALSRVFSAQTQKKQFCYIGSIKGHIGHPTNAAGIAGLIKAAMVLHKEQIPPVLNFTKPNPSIDFTSSPFKVAETLIPYPRNEMPRRTAVSSFGFGGTNAHAILDEAPIARQSGPSRPVQLIAISAKTATALETHSQRLADHFATAEAADFPDAAYTLIKGRKQLAYRRIAVASSPAEAAELLTRPNPTRTATKRCVRQKAPVVFLFGGQGTQYLNMGLYIYQDDPLFRTVVDECCEHLRPHLDQNLHDILYPSPPNRANAREALQNTCFTQPAVFTIEYAIACLWQSLGVEPAMMAGHSIGEFVAATLAGIFDLPDALKIAAVRGRLMQGMPTGSMLSVRAGSEQIAALLPPGIQLAAINAPSLCVVSGPTEDILEFQTLMESKEIICRPLHTSHAFHSAMMDPILGPLRELFNGIQLNPPQKTFISSVTGLPITEAQACDSEYWVMHARETVRFSSSLNWLVENGYDLFLECGPRATMCTLARQHMKPVMPVTAIPSIGNSNDDASEWESFLMAVGALWLEGVDIDWDVFYTHEQRRRVPLPTYPFERQRYWIEPALHIIGRASPAEGLSLNASQSIVPGQETRHPAADSSCHTSGTIPAKKDRIHAQLIDILAPVWGSDISLINSSATFLEQGFDSLSLTQVANGIRNKLGVKVSFGQLMKEYPNLDLLISYLSENIADNFLPETVSPHSPKTADRASEKNALTHSPDIRQLENKIEGLASKISQLTAMIGSSLVAHADPNNQESVKLLESTVPQRGIYFSSRLSDSLSATYNESVTIWVEGAIDAQKMRNAANKLVERHDALRTSFDDAGQQLQIAPLMFLDIEVHDFTAFNQETKKDTLQKLLLEETAVPLSLPNGPLFRSKIIIIDPDRAAVVLTGHHTICDGWSLDVLIHDFCAFYSEEISGNKQALREATPYADYVRMVAIRESQDSFKAARQFWEKKLSTGFHALLLPADQARTGQRKFTSRRKELRIDSDKTRFLRSAAAKQGVSFFALILGAYALSLARISRQHHFVIALPTAEQPVLGQPDLVGHCVNMIPFEVRFDAGLSIQAFLTAVQENLVTSHNHAIYTMTHLLEKLRPAKRNAGITPVSAGITSVRKYLSSELPQEGFKADYDINAKSFESFEWYVTALEDGDELVLRGNYDTGLFNESTASNWLNDFRDILSGISTDPAQTINKIVNFDFGNATNEPKALFLLAKDHEETSISGSSGKPPDAQNSIQSKDPSKSTVKKVESQLIDMWKIILGVRDIEPLDNFFDLGGNSMAAARLFATMEKELNCRLPLSVLFEFPTPRSLGQKISSLTPADDWRSLVTINRQGSQRPIFLIHGAEGNLLIYRALALHLGVDQPVYGLQARGVDGSDLGDTDFEQVASRYISEIQTIQPHGPYTLGGYCLGGTIALEMAHQLQAMGESVSLVVMFENYNIQAMKWPLHISTQICNKALNTYYHFLNLISARGGWFVFLKEKLKVEISRAILSARYLWVKTQRQIGRQDKRLHHLKVGEAYDKALARYSVKPYSGRVVLFLAKKSLWGFPSAKGGWGSIIKGGLEVCILPIYPKGSMIEPFVKDLALKLRAILDETRTELDICDGQKEAK